MPAGRGGGLRTAPRWVALLALGAAVLGGGTPTGSPAPAAGCPPLAEAEPLTVTVRGKDGRAYGATGYRLGNGQALVPVRGLLEGAGPTYWDEPGQTVSLLGPRDVLSVHFRGGRAEARTAILNGKPVAVYAVRCGAQVFLPADLAAAVLQLDLAGPYNGRVELIAQ